MCGRLKAFFGKLAAQLYIEGVDFFLFAFFDHEIHNFAVGDGARGAFSAVAAELGAFLGHNSVGCAVFVPFGEHERNAHNEVVAAAAHLRGIALAIDLIGKVDNLRYGLRGAFKLFAHGERVGTLIAEYAVDGVDPEGNEFFDGLRHRGNFCSYLRALVRGAKGCERGDRVLHSQMLYHIPCVEPALRVRDYIDLVGLLRLQNFGNLRFQLGGVALHRAEAVRFGGVDAAALRP